MVWLDWLIVAMAIWFVFQGLVKGAAASLLGALAIVVSYIGAAALLPSFGEVLTRFLMALIRSEEFTRDWARTVSFVFTFLVGYIILLLLISVLPGAKRPAMQAQVLGVFMGAAKASVAAMALVGILLASPYSEPIMRDIQERSSFAKLAATAQRRSIQVLSQASPIPFPPVGPDHKF
ncbi:MAG: CvpA family protein [Armatimonadetes bacterium]|nr:CvpA family protein [Armatimonadota bacterium]